MLKREDERIIETPTEARQAEPGPSVFLLLVVSVALAISAMSVVWLFFSGHEACCSAS